MEFIIYWLYLDIVLNSKLKGESRSFRNGKGLGSHGVSPLPNLTLDSNSAPLDPWDPPETSLPCLRGGRPLRASVMQGEEFQGGETGFDFPSIFIPRFSIFRRFFPKTFHLMGLFTEDEEKNLPRADLGRLKAPYKAWLSRPLNENGSAASGGSATKTYQSM